jgi:hypothetical protein
MLFAVALTIGSGLSRWVHEIEKAKQKQRQYRLNNRLCLKCGFNLTETIARGRVRTPECDK